MRFLRKKNQKRTDAPTACLATRDSIGDVTPILLSTLLLSVAGFPQERFGTSFLVIRSV